MDATHNKAVIGLSVAGSPGFQFLDLGTTPTFEPAFASPSGEISEDPLIDPVRNLLLSAAESGNYEIVNVATSTSPTFFENGTGGGELDSSGEDCSTGIALAPVEFSDPTGVYIADLNQVAFTPGSPGTWAAPSQVQSLSESSARVAWGHTRRDRGGAGDAYGPSGPGIRRQRCHGNCASSDVGQRHARNQRLGHVQRWEQLLKWL